MLLSLILGDLYEVSTHVDFFFSDVPELYFFYFE